MKKLFLLFFLLICLFNVCSCGKNNHEDNTDLNHIISNIKSYKYQVNYMSNGTTLKKDYIYNLGNIKTMIDNVEYVLFYNNTDKQYYINYNKTNFIKDDETNYVTYYQLFDEVHLSKINSSNYNKNDNIYTCINNQVKNEFTNIFNNYNNEYICKSISIEIKNNEIYKLNAVVSYLNVDYTIEIYFSNYNNCSFETPIVPTLENKEIIDISYPKEFSVNIGTSFEDALEQLKFTITYSNNEKIKLSAKDVSAICKEYDPNFEDSYKVEFIIDELHKIEVTIKVEFNSSDSDPLTLQQYGDSKGLTYGLPSTGNSKALVIPVSFVDYRAPVSMKSDLEKAFFGSSNDTGWESLSSYYYKSSYGKLNITGKVLDVYSTGKTSSYYQRKYLAGEDADYEIIKAALEYYDDQINYDEYDSNKDGYIDSLYIIYTTPIDQVNNNTLWWAYTYEYLTSDYEYYDNVEVDYYCFLGYEFFYERAASGKRIMLNTETVIHETGHLLGLDDYYDYDKSVGPNGGIGGGDMMDFNIGDHNPFSKILLGWVTPIVVTKDTSIELSQFPTSGECLIILDKFNNNYFDEYYVVDYYAPTYLNQLEAGYQGLFSEKGIRIYHVDARIDYTESKSLISIFKFNNSYTEHRLISLVQASGLNTINYNKFSTNADLFKASMSYKFNSWYSSSNVNFMMNVESLGEKAVLNISII